MDCPTKEQVDAAIETLEAAGFDICAHQHRLVDDMWRQESSIRRDIDEANDGDRDAAVRLIERLADGLSRVNGYGDQLSLLSPSLSSYFADAMRSVAGLYSNDETRTKQGVEVALNLARNNRSKDGKTKQKYRKAALVKNMLTDQGCKGEAAREVLSQVVGRGGEEIDDRILRGLVKEGNELLKSDTALRAAIVSGNNQGEKPKGVLFIF